MTLIPNVIFSIAGNPKSGKTHLAMTCPPPIKVYSFDLGAEFIRNKRFPNKAIDISKFPMPIVEEDPAPAWATPIWKRFLEEYKKDVEEAKYKTLVIDTATALWAIIHQFITEEKNRKKILEVEYFVPNLKMSSIYARAQVANINLVTTHYLKDRYVDEKNTGIQVLDGWGRTEGMVDVPLWMRFELKGGKGQFITTIRPNRYEPEVAGKELVNTDYDEIMALLGV